MILDDSNFLLYAMNNYSNIQCHCIEEFNEDLQRFMYLSKLLSRYHEHNELRERLILNHIIVLYNLFGDAATNMLFFKCDKSHWDTLGTFLIYLNRMPDILIEHNLTISSLAIDQNIMKKLQKL